MNWRNFAAAVFMLAILVFGATIGLIEYGKRQFTMPGPLEQAIFFSIPKGATVDLVSNSLLEQGAISSAGIFRAGATYTNNAVNIRFGTFEIPIEASMEEILQLITRSSASREQYIVTFSLSGSGAQTVLRERIAGTDDLRELARFKSGEQVPESYGNLLASGVPIKFRIAVPEGLTNWQVVNELESANFLSGPVVEVPVEGSLAPNTYQVDQGSDRSDLIERMKATQTSMLEEEWESRSAHLPFSTPGEALILASIIEKETGVPEERDLVASVFVNRLKKGMKLQTDPTVIYGLSEGKGVLDRKLLSNDLKVKTPFNTYIVDGFPPTPIANPGRLSIRAALHPAETDFLFFVADGTGGHVFAKTFDEHKRNVHKWRKIAWSQDANN